MDREISTAEAGKNALPEGVQDYLPEECYNKNRVTCELLEEFRLWGYDRLETAPLGYFDHFQSGQAAIDQRRMFKLTDGDGSILVLRPDITLPIARLAATRLADADPVRLCYEGNIFETGAASKTRVQAQAGVEYFGTPGSDGDFEVISLAASALRKIGLHDFKIDIGQVGFFKGLMEEHGLTPEEAEEIRCLVDKKNMLGVELLLRKIGAAPGAYEAIKSVPSLFGGKEVLSRAEKLCRNEMSRMALKGLADVYDRLCAAGFEAEISIDLGMVQRISYYSGVVFRGLSRYIGAPILTGGRYDGLTEGMGKHLPATGFAVDIKKVLVALERQNALVKLPNVDAAVCSDGGERETFEYLYQLRKRGLRAVRVAMPPAECVSYCMRRGISQAYHIGKDNKAVKIYG